LLAQEHASKISNRRSQRIADKDVNSAHDRVEQNTAQRMDEQAWYEAYHHLNDDKKNKDKTCN